jgi:hypothetical protein
MADSALQLWGQFFGVFRHYARPVDERYAMMEANLSDPSPQVQP